MVLPLSVLALTADQDFVGTVTVRNSTALAVNSFARVNNNPATLQSGGIFRPVGNPTSVITYSNGSIASTGGQIAPFGNANTHGVRFDSTCSIELTSGTTSMGFGNQANGRGIMYFDCVISGSGGLFLAQGTNNNVATRVFSNLNTFAGGLQLNSDGGGGNISIVLETDSNGMGAGPLGSGELNLNSAGSSRIIASGGARSIDNALRHASSGPFRLATDNVVGSPLPPAFTGHDLSISGPVTLGGASPVGTVRRFEVQGSLTLTLSGPVSVSSNTAGIRKEQTGTLVIDNAALGANGNYEVLDGTLLLNTGATTNSAVQPVSVVSGATFGGTAIVDRNLIMSSGARLHPGGLTTPGTLTFGRNVNLGGPASVVRYRLGSASDTITLASQDSMPVSVDLASAAIEIEDGPGFAPALYTLVSSVHASQTFSGTFGTLSGIPMGFTATVLYPGDAIPASLGGGTVADGSVLLAVESTGPSVTLTSPVGAETWEVYDAQSVTWTNGGGFSDNVDILLSLDGGATYPITLGSNVANTGSFTVPAATLAYAGLSARVRVEATMGGSPASASSANFRILADIEGGNSNVNLADLALLLVQFGGPSASPPADLNGDGNVNAADLNLLLEQFGL